MKYSVGLLLILFTLDLSAQIDSTWLKEDSWKKDSSIRTKMLAFEEFMKSFPEGEGELTFYLRAEKILRINEWSSTEDIIIIRDFFFSDTVLSAVHVREYKYPKTGGVANHLHANRVSEYLVLFNKGKFVRNHIILASKKGYGKSEEYLQNASLYRQVSILAQ